MKARMSSTNASRMSSTNAARMSLTNASRNVRFDRVDISFDLG